VILTVAAAKTSGGVAQGGSATITFSRAVISDLGNLAHGNEDSTPVVAAVTFKLDKDPAGADPTIAIAEVT
jgi:hypothetical protein